MISPLVHWPSFRSRSVLAALAVAAGMGASPTPRLSAAEDGPAPPKPPASSLIDTPSVALRKFTVMPGLRADLFAAEPDVRNPVALSIDEHGRVFVVESDRRRSSVFDIRAHREWLDTDFSFRTVADRAAFLRREVHPSHPAVLERLTKGGRGDFRDFNQDGTLDWRDLEVQSERIRLLEDINTDGRADRVSVFADGFTNIVAGVAAGVLARRGDVYFACIPDLWHFPGYPDALRTASPAPVAPAASVATPSQARAGRPSHRVNLLTGFGVHIAFGGHDMHGLIFGPDGRIYWSIADRGTDTNLFARLREPWPGLTPDLLAETGCIFRANPDGTDFEVVAWGLRNPQELAFDDEGNLFTADNNGDGGDKARWHHVVDGADFGWRLGWQWHEARAYQPKMGPWNGERLWHLAASNTAAWLLPPLAHIGHGPAGLAYNPGTGLPARFDRHFFLCDFPGHILTWTNLPDGASFKVGPIQNFFGDLGPTDIAFHPDGGVLVTDWFKTFDKTDQGRIYRIHDPATDAGPAVADTRRQLCLALPAAASLEFAHHIPGTADGLVARPPVSRRSEIEVIALLGHADARVREDALNEAVDWDVQTRLKGLRAGERPLEKTLHTGDNLRARAAALRGIERVAHAVQRLGGPAADRDDHRALTAGLTDPAPEIRAQAARALGALRIADAAGVVRRLLEDGEARVRFFAAEALGALGDRSATPALLELLRSNGDRDLYLRHAAVLALARIGDTNAMLRAVFASDPLPPRAVRLGVVLALRRLGHPALGGFLTDGDPQIVLEAARAIHDVPIEPALPQLAAMTTPKPGATTGHADGPGGESPFFVSRRILNANFRLGQAIHAQALVATAARPGPAEALRLEALELLSLWPQPPARDHFTGLWRPLAARPPGPAADALRPALPALLQDPSGDVRLAAFRAAQALLAGEFDPFVVFAETNQPPAVRIAALRSLAEGKHPRWRDAVKMAGADPLPALRTEATRLQGANADVQVLSRALETGSVPDQQAALAMLATAGTAAARRPIVRLMDELLAGRLPAALALDVLEAAEAAHDDPLRERLVRYTNSLSKSDPLAAWRPVLQGGRTNEGRATFYDNQQVACFRCHKLNGEGGEVGPELTGLAARRGREYLLESIIFPNRAIAPGFESALITMKNGTEYSGIVKAESAVEVELNSPEDGLLKLAKSEISERRRGLSPMPEELATVLSPRELRDLIEFLAAGN